MNGDPSSLTATAKFIGIQDGAAPRPPIELYTLTAPVGVYPVGTTVTRRTLEELGVKIPPDRHD